ncbi:MAG: N-acetyl-alpha-D-glucosaminyl L-malate synthase BshA [Myxococcota bacterium]
MEIPETLRIGIVCFPHMGGSGVVASEIALWLARQGQDVHLLSTQRPLRIPEQSAVQVHVIQRTEYPLFTSPLYTLPMASAIVQYTQKFNLQILHIHYAVPHAVSAYLALQQLDPQPKLITTLHGTDVSLMGREPSVHGLTQMALCTCDALTTPSQALCKEARDVFPLLGERPIQVIENFVDTERFAPISLTDKQSLSRLFPHSLHPGRIPILVHLSNFRAVKRPLDVIAVFQKVFAQQPCRLLMVGDGPLRKDAEQVIADAGLQHEVHFAGRAEQPERLLPHADLMIVPSEKESFGLAALEALSCGLPVIASDTPGLRELLAHPSYAKSTTVGNVQQMANDTLDWIRNPKQLRAAQRAARQRALAFGMKQNHAQRYLKLYQSLLS